MEVRDIWNKYERCKSFLDKKNLVSKTNKFWDFYLGDQWRSEDTKNENLPIMNMIKPVVKHKVATVCQNNTSVKYTDLKGRKELVGLYDNLSTMFTACWEQAKMDIHAWEMVKAAAIARDSYAYFGTKDVKDIQILSNMSVMLGDEQEPDIQRQPYIIIRERLHVNKIKEIAKANGIDETEIATIKPDEDKDYLINNKEDIGVSGDDGKTTSLIYLEKINGIVHVAKATKTCIYKPLTPIVQTKQGKEVGGLKLYPLVNFIWEDSPNSARGRGEVEGLIPNQIEVNKTLARIGQSVKMTAFPRIAYDSNAITNPEDLEKVGAAIEVQGVGAQSVNQMISYMQAAPMSSDARVFLNDLMTQTRELAGASDSALGQIDDPTRVAASALIAIRDQAALPMNEQVSKVKQLSEDLARLWVEIWLTYNPEGFSIAHEVDGVPVVIKISKEQLAQIEPDVKVDVSQDTTWTKQAEQTAADNLLSSGHITIEEYSEIIPENGVVPKAKLKAIIEKRKMLPQIPPEVQPNEVS